MMVVEIGLDALKKGHNEDTAASLQYLRDLLVIRKLGTIIALEDHIAEQNDLRKASYTG